MSQKEWPKQVKRFSASIRRKGLLPNLLSQQSFTINAIGEVFLTQRGSHTTRLTAFLVYKGESLNSRFVPATQGRFIDTGAKVVRKVIWQQISTGLTCDFNTRSHNSQSQTGSGKHLKYRVKYLRKSSLRLLFRNATLIDGWRDSGHTFKSPGEAFTRFEAHTTTDGFQREPPKVFFIVKPTASFFNSILA